MILGVDLISAHFTMNLYFDTDIRVDSCKLFAVHSMSLVALLQFSRYSVNVKSLIIIVFIILSEANSIGKVKMECFSPLFVTHKRIVWPNQDDSFSNDNYQSCTFFDIRSTNTKHETN